PRERFRSLAQTGDPNCRGNRVRYWRRAGRARAAPGRPRRPPDLTLNRRCVGALVAPRKALRSSSRWTIARPRVIGGALLLRGRPAANLSIDISGFSRIV